MTTKYCPECHRNCPFYHGYGRGTDNLVTCRHCSTLYVTSLTLREAYPLGDQYYPDNYARVCLPQKER